MTCDGVWYLRTLYKTRDSKNLHLYDPIHPTLFVEINQLLSLFQFIVNWKWLLTAIKLILLTLRIDCVTLAIQTNLTTPHFSKPVQLFGPQRHPKKLIYIACIKTITLLLCRQIKAKAQSINFFRLYKTLILKGFWDNIEAPFASGKHYTSFLLLL